jgi:3-dehydroquinate dehydratase type I
MSWRQRDMSRPRVCVVVTASDVGEAVETIGILEPQAPDIVEIRLDHMALIEDLEQLREATELPLIATNRSRDQGGHWKGSERERLAPLIRAAAIGFDYIDLELSAASIQETGGMVRDGGAELIVSHHDFERSFRFSELEEIMRRELKLGAEICKIVGTAHTKRDNLDYLGFLDSNRGRKIVSFGMGGAGALSRILSPLFGGAFTYASSDTGRESAPGQLTLAAMREIYGLLGV